MMRPRYMDHLEGVTDAATFHQLDIDTVYNIYQARDIIYRDATFIGDNRYRHIVANQLETGPIMGEDRLLDEFDIVRGQGIDIFNRFFRRPTRIGIDANRRRGDIADGLYIIEVMFGADFHFENRIVTSNQSLLRHIERRVDADG